MIRETAREFAENKIKPAAAEDLGRISIGLEAFGLAQAAMEEAIRLAKQRVAFGQPISQYQAIQLGFKRSGVQGAEEIKEQGLNVQ